MYSIKVLRSRGCPIFMVESWAVNNGSLSDGRLQPPTDEE